jgi:hypothetical protein
MQLDATKSRPLGAATLPGSARGRRSQKWGSGDARRELSEAVGGVLEQEPHPPPTVSGSL